MKSISPHVINYTWNRVSPTWDSMSFLAHAPIMYCYGTYKCVVTILPTFVPTKYLFETHKDKGKEDWEIYAWAVRDVMAKVGGFGKNE